MQELSRDNCCAIPVDFLDGLVPSVKTIETFRLHKSAQAFAELTSVFRLPTLFLGEEGGFRGSFFPEVVAHSKNAVRIARHTPSAWGNRV